MDERVNMARVRWAGIRGLGVIVRFTNELGNENYSLEMSPEHALRMLEALGVIIDDCNILAINRHASQEDK